MLWWRFLFWLANILFWVLAAGGVFAFVYICAVSDLRILLFSLPVVFLVIFILVFLSHWIHLYSEDPER